MTTNLALFLTRKETSELLRISTRSVDRLIATGRLQASRVTSRVLIPRAEIDRILAEGRK